jgi:hypothetical protein
MSFLLTSCTNLLSWKEKDEKADKTSERQDGLEGMGKIKVSIPEGRTSSSEVSVHTARSEKARSQVFNSNPALPTPSLLLRLQKEDVILISKTRPYEEERSADGGRLSDKLEAPSESLRWTRWLFRRC